MRQVLTLARMYLRHEGGQVHLHAIKGIIFPLTLYYLTSRIARTDEEIRIAFCSCVTIGLSFGGVSLVGNSVIDDRFAGRLRLIQAGGATLSDYLVVQMLQSMLYSFIVVATSVLVFGATGLAGAWSPGRLALAVPLTIGAGVIQASLALWIGFRVHTIAGAELLFVLVGLVAPFISPIFYEPELLPSWLAFAAGLSPFAAIHGTLLALLVGGPPGESIARMLLAAAALATLAVWTARARVRVGAANG